MIMPLGLHGLTALRHPNAFVLELSDSIKLNISYGDTRNPASMKCFLFSAPLRLVFHTFFDPGFGAPNPGCSTTSLAFEMFENSNSFSASPRVIRTQPPS